MVMKNVASYLLLLGICGFQPISGAERLVPKERWEYKIIDKQGITDQGLRLVIGKYAPGRSKEAKSLKGFALMEFTLKIVEAKDKSLIYKVNAIEMALNKLGKDGWELVAIKDSDYIFKRKLVAQKKDNH